MKIVNILCLLMMIATVSFGQADALKSADKNLKKFYLDSDATKLDQAITDITEAFSSGSLDSDPEALLLKAKIMNEIANTETLKKYADETYAMSHPNAAVMAAKALLAAYPLAEKKAMKREIMSGLEENENIINNMGIYAYQAQDMEGAYENFKASLDVYDFLSANGANSRMDDEVVRNDQILYTAITAFTAGKKAESKPFLMKLYDAGTSEPFVYEKLYQLANEAGEADATKYLEQGKEKNPNDSSLLFAEINHYLQKGELNILIDKLKMAIEKEPDNISVYTTTGNVFDQLAAKAREDGDSTKAQEYSDEAMSYYNQAMAKDPENFDVQYSMGQMLYNQAAALVPSLNALSDDMSAAGLKKYNDLKGNMDGLFKKALPFFQKAEMLKGDDVNTVIALKEIYARLNDFEKSNEYKAKYESLTGGQ